MKRLILVIAAIAMGLSLIGCAEDTTQASTQEQGGKTPPGQENLGGSDGGEALKPK